MSVYIYIGGGFYFVPTTKQEDCQPTINDFIRERVCFSTLTRNVRIDDDGGGGGELKMDERVSE